MTALRACWLKGQTGKHLRVMREIGCRAVRLENSVALIADSSGRVIYTLTMRGNSADRRKSFRPLRRWLAS